jgi:anti-sigma28 factor (negative regulator of flagellin synthesis)
MFSSPNASTALPPADDDRSAVVERLRDLHERGELSVDVDRLADRMIDVLTHSNDHD